MNERLARLSEILSPLSDRESKAIQARFGLLYDGDSPRSLAETARLYKITRERMRQILARAMEKLRRLYGDGIEDELRAGVIMDWRARALAAEAEVARLRAIVAEYESAEKAARDMLG